MADSGPVLLLHMGTIIFVVRPGAGERDFVFQTVVVQVVVDELAAII